MRKGTLYTVGALAVGAAGTRWLLRRRYERAHRDQ